MPYIIKRYSNRKLYDVQESRYVTLEELEGLIRAGKEIAVLDAASGKDITSVTLAQIILENERSARAALPAALLRQLIKHGEAWQEFVEGSLRASLEGVTATQWEADRIFKAWAARSGMAPAEGPPPREEKANPAAEAEDLRSELTTLKERLKSFEKRLGKKRR